MSTARSSKRDVVISFDLCDVSHLSARQHETQILGKQFAPPPSERGFLSAPLNGGMGEKRSPGWKLTYQRCLDCLVFTHAKRRF